jgi:hypothetical protein
MLKYSGIANKRYFYALTAVGAAVQVLNFAKYLIQA